MLARDESVRAADAGEAPLSDASKSKLQNAQKKSGKEAAGPLAQKKRKDQKLAKKMRVVKANAVSEEVAVLASGHSEQFGALEKLPSSDISFTESVGEMTIS